MSGSIVAAGFDFSSTSNPAAIAAAETAKARIQTAYMVALGRPRKEDDARIKILAACRRPAFAEKALYSKPVGREKITGASIRLAELMMREWGNIQTDHQVVFDDEAVRRIKVTVIDLETNTTFSKEVQFNKTVERKNGEGKEIIGERLNSKGEKIYIVKATEDEISMREASMISKALRNEGLRLIPEDIMDEAKEAVKETMDKRDKTDPEASKKRIMDSFAGHGIMPSDIEKYLKHPLTQTTPAEISDLRAVYNAVKNGEAKWADYVQDVVSAEESPASNTRSLLLGGQDAPPK